tara:strand:- start:524 stop:811 length:288 start_codon:yes stop_codon:yes gene_type:complete
MSKTTDPIFPDGFIFKRKDTSPDWVHGSLSIKVDEAIAFLTANQSNGWVNIEMKTGKSGKHYCELDTWKPDPSKAKTKTVSDDSTSSADGESVPF